MGFLSKLAEAFKAVAAETSAEVCSTIAATKADSVTGQTMETSKVQWHHRVIVKVAFGLFYMRVFLKKFFTRVKNSTTITKLKMPLESGLEPQPVWKLGLSGFVKSWISGTILVCGIIVAYSIMPFWTKIQIAVPLLLGGMFLYGDGLREFVQFFYGMQL